MSQRSLRSSAPRLRGSFGPYAAALAVAVAALTATPALAAVPTPPPLSSIGHAAADDDADSDTDMNTDRPAATDPAATEAEASEAEAEAAGATAPREYKGRVIAKSGLLLRDKPTRGSRVIGSAAYGQIVHIFCKTQGDNVNGNDRWYLLTDGTWAWGSAAYIDNIGQAPRWC